MSETFSVSYNFGRSEKNLERSDKYDSHSKFISGTTVLICNVQLLATDNTNSNINTNPNICSSMAIWIN